MRYNLHQTGNAQTYNKVLWNLNEYAPPTLHTTRLLDDQTNELWTTGRRGKEPTLSIRTYV